MKIATYKRHWLLKAEPDAKLSELDPDGQKFFKNWLTPSGDATGVTVVTKGTLIIAFFRWENYDRKKLWALGTWVQPEFRHLGLAQWMWDITLKRIKPQKVHVTAVTPKGYKLAKHLKKQFPAYKWSIIKFFPD
jgi:hypothetical protein